MLRLRRLVEKQGGKVVDGGKHFIVRGRDGAVVTVMSKGSSQAMFKPIKTKLRHAGFDV